MSYGNYGGPPSQPPPGGYGQGYGQQGGQQGYYQQQQQGYQGQGGHPGNHQGGNPGYGGPPGPPGPRDPLRALFENVDNDKSGHISAVELQKALKNGDLSDFDLDTVKLLMTMFDTDRSGTIVYDEFAGLFKYIQDWQNVFRHFDRDRSGTIEGHELNAALVQFGYHLNPQLLQLLERKYVFEKGSVTAAPSQYGQPPRPGGITFDRFVRCCVVVRQLTEAFTRLDTQRSGWIQINYDTFMQTVLAAP